MLSKGISWPSEGIFHKFVFDLHVLRSSDSDVILHSADKHEINC